MMFFGAWTAIGHTRTNKTVLLPFAEFCLPNYFCQDL
jgi:hypothetical protein